MSNQFCHGYQQRHLYSGKPTTQTCRQSAPRSLLSIVCESGQVQSSPWCCVGTRRLTQYCISWQKYVAWLCQSHSQEALKHLRQLPHVRMKTQLLAVPLITSTYSRHLLERASHCQRNGVLDQRIVGCGEAEPGRLSAVAAATPVSTYAVTAWHLGHACGWVYQKSRGGHSSPGLRATRARQNPGPPGPDHRSGQSRWCPDVCLLCSKALM